MSSSYIQSTKKIVYDTNGILKKNLSFYPKLDSPLYTATPIFYPYIIYDKTDFLAVYAFYRKIPSYKGFLFTLRRSSDNLEKDFHSTDDVPYWLGTSTGYVKVWYDQSGGGKNFIETTYSVQPRYVHNDSLFGNRSSMDLSTDRGMAGSFTNTATTNHCYCMAICVVNSAYRILAGSNNWLVGPYGGVYNVHSNGFTGGPAVVIGKAKIQSAIRYGGGGYRNRINGVEWPTLAGPEGAGTLNLGVRGMYSEGAGSRIAELVIKDKTGNEVLVKEVERLVNSRYSIY